MTDDSKVIWLKKAPVPEQSGIDVIHDATHVRPLTILGCTCGNKTFALVYTGDTFPKLQCVVCGVSHGHVGWIDHDPE